MQEKDFMGLAVKKETRDEVSDSTPARSLAMSWSASNKASALPQLLSFQGLEEKPMTGFDSLMANGLVSITRTKAFDCDEKQYSGVVQKNMAPENQGRYWTSTALNLFDSHTIHKPLNGQTNAAFSPAGVTLNQPFVTTSASPQPLPGITMANPVQAIPSSCSFVGNTDFRNAPIISAASSQLTLFYAGSVCVYDNISPEKAQAIMLLAGNTSHVTNSTATPGAPVQLSVPRSSGIGGFVVNQNYGATFRCQNAIPITIYQPRGNDTTDVKPAGTLLSPTNNLDPLSAISSSIVLSSRTVPQFRRKSLAQFLKKRRERLTAASPYVDKQPANCSTPGAVSTSLSVNSSGSSPLPDII